MARHPTARPRGAMDNLRLCPSGLEGPSSRWLRFIHLMASARVGGWSGPRRCSSVLLAVMCQVMVWRWRLPATSASCRYMVGVARTWTMFAVKPWAGWMLTA